jgi:predicted AlkP superfamily pyrophosphatase or phosphodiesterase
MHFVSSVTPALLTCSLLLLFCSHTSTAAPGRNTVLWISADGMRSDYPGRAETPFLNRLQAEGAFSREMVPVFPSVTFSSHVSQATGVLPEEHGITGNSFYDSGTRRIHRYPGDLALLEAEPIWITAPRQGVRTAVLDWPLAHNQRGAITSDYFGERYERGLDDEHRLSRLLDLWEADNHEDPLRLILGYVESPDKEGHSFGPDDPLVMEAVERVDAILSRTFDRALAIWKSKKPGPADNLYLVISSDHGMSRVKSLVHPGNLTGLEGREGVTIITTGNLGSIHFDQIEEHEEREKVIAATLDRLAGFDFVRAHRREEIPAEWGMRHPTRVGEILVVLENGYTFSRRPREIVQSAEEGGGPLGMHGYDPATNPEMLTPLFIFRVRNPIGGFEIKQGHSLQFHATVCEILQIETAPSARPDAIIWNAPPAENEDNTSASPVQESSLESPLDHGDGKA